MRYLLPRHGFRLDFLGVAHLLLLLGGCYQACHLFASPIQLSFPGYPFLDIVLLNLVIDGIELLLMGVNVEALPDDAAQVVSGCRCEVKHEGHHE